MTTKLCLICGTEFTSDTCHNCGEASWTPVAEKPAPTQEPAQVPEPRVERERKGSRR